MGAAHTCHLGRLFAYQGYFEQAESELGGAQAVYDSYGVSETNFVGVVRAYHAWDRLLQGDAASARSIAQQALELALNGTRSAYAGERDAIRAKWIIGAALVNLASDRQRRRGSTGGRNPSLRALARCYHINLVEMEPDILLGLARWHRVKGNSQQAHACAEEAMTIADRCEYRLKKAEIHNTLAILLLEAGDPGISRNHAQTAYELAWCDGPPYCYKPALEEAAMLLREAAQHS